MAATARCGTLTYEDADRDDDEENVPNDDQRDQQKALRNERESNIM
jgi:hypothetical protein